MTVVVLTDRFDPDPGVDLLVAELRRRDVPVLRFDPADLPEQLTVAAELSGVEWTGRLGAGDEWCDPTSITGVFYRRPSGLAFEFGLDGGDDRWSATQARLGVGGLLSAVGSWVNHPQRSGYAEYVPVLLRAARRVGLRVPRTCVTNDPATARRFVGDFGRAVRAPFRGHGVADGDDATLVSAAECDERITGTVHLFRQRVPTEHRVRVAVVDDRVFAVHSGPRPNAGDRRPHAVPPSVERAVVELLRAFELRFAGLDFAVDGRDRWWLLGFDPNGPVGTVAVAGRGGETGLRIVAALADALTGLPRR